jgi:putative drug exporter of the RND superfamily
MEALARLAVARPRAMIAAWLSVVGLLGLVGFGLEEHLHRSNLNIPGTDAQRADDLAKERFGDNVDLIVLLEGPRGAVDRQGRSVAAALERQPSVTVLGPWDPGAAAALRPKPDKALVLVRSDRPFEEVSRHVVPKIRSDVSRLTGPPVESHVSGYADIAAGIHGSSVKAIERAEVVAAPVLLLVLLLVFRSPIAAGLPLFAGFTTIGAARGVLELVNGATDLDVVSLNLASMMGLALGVDYALLLVSRFREELDAGATSDDAAVTAVRTAGKTILFAGIALAFAMMAALAVAPGKLLWSASFGVFVAVLLSVAGALTAMPAALALVGTRIDRWSFGKRSSSGGAFAGLALRALRRPALAAGLVALLVGALAAPAVALDAGAPDPRVLPKSAPQRADFDAVQRALGGGWTAPFEITVATRSGAITDPDRLEALDRWQDRVSRWSDVAAVLGPGAIAERTRDLDRASGQLARADSAVRRGLRDQGRLIDGLAQAGAGVDQVRTGLARAAGGAGQLAAGGGRASGGAAALRSGIAQARAGSERLGAGLGTARAGSSALAEGAQRGRRGARSLASGLVRARSGTRSGRPRVRELAVGLDRGAGDLERLREPARTAQSELRKALNGLDRMLPTSRADPQYRDVYEAVGTAYGAVSGKHPLTGRPVRSGYDGLDASLAQASGGARDAAAGVRRLGTALVELEGGLGRLARGSTRLERGAARLEAGVSELRRGLERLDEGGGALAGGLGRLQRGAGSLAGGVGRLQTGAGTLQQGLHDGAGRTGELREGVQRMHDGAVAARIRTKRLGSGLEGSDRLVDTISSGYFVLAALDKGSRAERKGATFAVNLDRGGTAANIVVIGKGVPSRSDNALRPRLEKALPSLERETGTVARVGGPAATLQDFDSTTSSRFWLLVGALAGVTYLVLVPILRSVLLPLLAVLLNLFTVAAAFGVLVLLFQGDALLGGPGYIDAIMVSGVFSVVFGLSIDYEVFLLARMREGYLLTGTTEGAIEYGLRRTAGVVTGAALIMTGVFVAFALSNIASMRQLGIGLTVAVILDATLVRLVLLPAAIRLVGDRVWWLPAWRRPGRLAAEG